MFYPGGGYFGLYFLRLPLAVPAEVMSATLYIFTALVMEYNRQAMSADTNIRTLSTGEMQIAAGDSATLQVATQQTSVTER